MSRNERIKQVRTLTGMNQGAFAKWLGVSSQQLVSDWERGEKTPTPQMVELAELKIEKEAGMQVIDLLGQEPLEISEVIEMAGCGSGRLDHGNWHYDSDETRAALHPTEMSIEQAGRYEYDLFALFDDGNGARWFPVDVR